MFERRRLKLLTGDVFVFGYPADSRARVPSRRLRENAFLLFLARLIPTLSKLNRASLSAILERKCARSRTTRTHLMPSTTSAPRNNSPPLAGNIGESQGDCSLYLSPALLLLPAMRSVIRQIFIISSGLILPGHVAAMPIVRRRSRLNRATVRRNMA